MKALVMVSLALLPLLQADVYIFKEVVKPSEPFSSDWAFVIDNSSSIWWKPERGVIEKVLTAFDTSTSYPGDELHFCTYAFHDNIEEHIVPGSQRPLTHLLKLRSG